MGKRAVQRLETIPTRRVEPTEAGIPNLADMGERIRLTPVAIKAFTRIVDLWELSASEATALLGGISERSWFRFRKTAPDELTQDQLTRISALTGLFKGLGLLFSEPLSSEWVKRPNRHALFAGKPPVEAMIAGGIPKMLQTRAYIDALRGGL